MIFFGKIPFLPFGFSKLLALNSFRFLRLSTRRCHFTSRQLIRKLIFRITSIRSLKMDLAALVMSRIEIMLSSVGPGMKVLMMDPDTTTSVRYIQFYCCVSGVPIFELVNHHFWLSYSEHWIEFFVHWTLQLLNTTAVRVGTPFLAESIALCP